MLQFTIKTKDIASKANLLVQAANLKSLGAAVIEKVGLQITGKTINLIAVNEANAVRIGGIPIEVVNGEVGEMADRTTMIDLKKFAGIIRQSKDTLNISLSDTGVDILSKNKYNLDAYRVDRDISPNLRMANKAIKLKPLQELFDKANLITQNVNVTTTGAGCLISGNQLYATDRVSALYVKNTGLSEYLPKVEADLLFSPDLFSTCLPKLDIEEGYLGLTENGDQIVISAGDVTIYKHLMTGQYEKAKILKITEIVKNISEENGVLATLDFAELIETFNDYQKIVELDDHVLTIDREGKLIIHSHNSKMGTGGEVSVKLKNLKMPESLGKTFSGNFSTSSILIAEEIFGKREKTEQEIRMGVVTVKKVPTPNIMAFDTDEMLLFIVPRK
jgi:hypothetical protein